MDVLTAEQRHYNMSRIRSGDTGPEKMVRSYLFRKGLRFRKNDRRLPGRPDIVLPKYRTVIFVNGCFWHGHQGCRYATVPQTNTRFWVSKIENNRKRDNRVAEELRNMGWNVITVWECHLRKGVSENTLGELFDRIRSGQTGR